MVLELSKTKVIQFMNCAWYKKKDATYSDIIAFVKRHIWCFRNYTKSDQNGDLNNFDDDFFEAILDVLCYTT
jgi:hypothetical protein